MTPAFKMPKTIWITPANTTANRKILKAPSSVIAFNTITVSPAAGPDTEVCEPESAPITMPPTTPAMIPENKGAPEAKAIPKHSGKATRNTTRPAGRSLLRWGDKLALALSVKK